MDIVLRPLVAQDAEVLASWAIDPLFCAHAGWRPRSTVDDAIPWWRQAIAEPDPTLTRLLALRDGEPVGYVDLHGDEEGVRELGFLIGPSARWHHGLGTAAAVAGLDYGFTELELSRIWAEALEANLGSVRILRSIGMQESGWGSVEEYLGASSTYLQFSLSRADWMASRDLS